MPALLTEPQIKTALKSVPSWSLSTGHRAITKVFMFSNFVKAFAFMEKVAVVAEELDHHPDWSNSYKIVNVRLTTHSAGGLTELDFKLAHEMDELI